MKVEMTNGIPLCPTCKYPTQRIGGLSSVTDSYYPPSYNEEGINTNPDRNIHTHYYQCMGCSSHYTIVGNEVDGYNYGR